MKASLALPHCEIDAPGLWLEQAMSQHSTRAQRVRLAAHARQLLRGRGCWSHSHHRVRPGRGAGQPIQLINRVHTTVSWLQLPSGFNGFATVLLLNVSACRQMP
jgi:hypothetical protein